MNPILRIQYNDLTHFAKLIYEHETQYNGNTVRTEIYNDNGINVLAVIHNKRIISLTILNENPAN